MLTVFILDHLAFLIQIVAAILALKLIKAAGWSKEWAVLGLAVCLQVAWIASNTVQRMSKVPLNVPFTTHDLINSLLALSVSILFLVGILMIEHEPEAQELCHLCEKKADECECETTTVG